MRKITQLICIIIVLTLCGCGTSSLYASPGKSYYKMDCLTDASFSIPERFYSLATAINQISDDTEYERSVPYSYKNGTDEYIMFCMNELIIACAHTSFKFYESEDKLTALQSAPLFNIWFDTLNKKLNYDDGSKGTIYKIICSVKAEVAITTNLFDDYVGKLATICNTETQEEWSIFVGVPGTTNKDIDDNRMNVINSITKSLNFTNNTTTVAEAPTYEVVVSGLEASNEEVVSETDIKETPDKSPTEEVTDLVPEEEDTDETKPESSSPNETVPGKTEDQTPVETPVEEPIKEPELLEVGGSKEKKIEAPKVGINKTNQKENEKNIGTAYSSDIYSMLNIGEVGLLSLFDNPDFPITIRINKRYSGEDAVNLIKDSLKDAPYNYFDAPDGYSWEAVTYDIGYEGYDEPPYVNIRLIGLDGNNLKYKGISNSTMTHDANYSIQYSQENAYGLVCYYAIPNGCKEYALECGGDSNIDSSLLSAYYHIKK